MMKVDVRVGGERRIGHTGRTETNEEKQRGVKSKDCSMKKVQ